MIGQNSLKQALKVDIALSVPMAEALQKWSLMYVNQAPWLNGEVKSLNLPAAIAAEISRAVTIEMVVDVSGSPRANFLATQMETIIPKLRQVIEYGTAKGGLMFKPYIRGTGVAVDFVQADQFYPVAFDANGSITSCVFADQRTVGQNFYTRLEFHQMIPGGCRITNTAFKSSTRDMLGIQVSLAEIPDWAEIQPDATILNIDKPLFAYFKFPLANNIDPTSPLGVSCYARAVDLIRDADVQWSDLLWEFDSGKRALYVDVLAFNKDPKTGLPVLPNKRLYRTLNTTSQIGKGEELFKEWTPDLREANLINGLNAILRKIEFACGLAYGTLSDPNVDALTATEIKASKQRTYATITDTQKALQEALEQLLYAMDTWATLGGLAPAGTYQAKYDFDDSIVADHDTQFTQDQMTQTMGAMPKYQFLMRNYGMSEADAKKWIQEAQGESAAAMDAFGLGAGGGAGDGKTPPQDGNGQGNGNMPENMPNNMPANQGA